MFFVKLLLKKIKPWKVPAVVGSNVVVGRLTYEGRMNNSKSEKFI